MLHIAVKDFTPIPRFGRISNRWPPVQPRRARWLQSLFRCSQERCIGNRVLHYILHMATRSYIKHNQSFPIFSQTCMKGKIYYLNFFIMPVKPTGKMHQRCMKTVFGLLLKHFWILDKFILMVWTHFWNVILILGQFNLSSNKGIVFRLPQYLAVTV